LPRSRIGWRLGEKKAQARMDTDFLDWALADFSGYVAADELYDLYSAYCRKGWGGRVRQNLPPGHANFNRRLCLTTLAIKRSEPFSKLHENRP
jgi:hypothetical protein